MFRRLYDWMGSKVNSPFAVPFLGALFFIEAIFFVPVDPLLVLYCVKHQHRALYFAAVATLCSVLGGIGAYYIGFALWETIGHKLISSLITPEKFSEVTTSFKTHQISAVLIAGFTPVPYKAVTLAAGFCQLPLIPFVLCSLIARGSRFFMVAGTIWYWGEHIEKYIDRYFNLLVILFVLMILLIAWLFV
jgi:membrane protein YqaA with SNARE-associated domain